MRVTRATDEVLRGDKIKAGVQVVGVVGDGEIVARVRLQCLVIDKQIESIRRSRHGYADCWGGHGLQFLGWVNEPAKEFISTPPRMDIVLPVSLGEALDKLTILDIKMSKIQDPQRRTDVQKEYDVLMNSLNAYVVAYPYHYRILREVNLAIWEIQDRFHGKDTSADEGAKLCREILLENDRRFRVKAKINALANSALREQKGYAKKKALVYTHLGLGDMYWMNGAVRYLSTAYDEVLVVCKRRNEVNAAAMYADDPTIKLLVIDDDIDLHPWSVRRHFFADQGYTVYSCGFFAPRPDKAIYDLPNSFYDDMAISKEIRRSYFHVPRTEAARGLAEVFKGRPYIVVHQQSSVQTIPIVEKLLAAGETRLIIDLNKNHVDPVKDPAGHALAQLVVEKPLLDYTYLIEGAEELHMIESSIYCLASHLDLGNVKRRLCYEPWGGDAERLGVFTTGTV